ncbi:hypothetical protein [Promicromonospora sp. NPDC019610]|uniref:hypothetical protein n=1 Tax=Promicromonospora sp. NPDC019610 TaxID=3364405 RepID=UPI00378E0807
MYFSEVFGVNATDTEWFDPLMEVDTQLFIDPFLIYKETSGRWVSAADQIAQYFQDGFEILAGHQDRPDSLQYRKTVRLMVFPEPSEFGLGYTASSRKGSGTAEGFARRIVGAMAEAIKRGLEDLHHFEELGVLVDRIGKDRISDIAANILKPDFIAYTQDVCRELGVPLVETEVPHAEFDEHRLQWVSARFELPVNPDTGEAVLLTPKRFLRELPTLDAAEWWKWAEPYFRDDVNMDLASKLKKEDIIALARRYPEKVREWTEVKEDQPPKPYDVDSDPEGLHSWRAHTRSTAQDLPLGFTGTPTARDIDQFIGMVNEKFRLFVEEKGGWRLLWNDDTKRPKKELGIQLLYKGVVQSYCEAYGVRLDREVELGRGPVDFVFTRTASERALMEVKKMDNGEFWNGLEQQLLSYMESDECSRGWFLAVRFADTRTQEKRTSELSARTRSLRRATGFDIHSAWVDARPKKSASNLRPDAPDTLVGEEDPEFADS